MNRRPVRRLAAVSLVAVPLLWASACGESGSDPDASASPAAEGESAGVDLDSPGDDLLSDSRWGGPVPGDTVNASWRFPASYEPTGENVPNNEARSRDGDTDYRMVIATYPGADPVEEAAEKLRAGAEKAGQTVELESISIEGRDFISVIQQDGGSSRRNLFHAPEEGSSHFLVVLEAATPLDETPQKRLDEYYQTAASLEFEPAAG